MGSEYSSSYGLNYQLEEKVDLPAGLSPGYSPWTLYKGVSCVDKSPVSVFVYRLGSADAAQKDSLKRAENCAKYLKILRHPNIVRFLDVVCISEDMWIVTEAVTPLTLILDSLSPFEITSGLYNIIEVLSFLHSQANLCHNNVCLESIFVSETGVWKLGAMECACSFKDATTEFLKRCKSFRSKHAISPAEQSGVTMGPDNGCARDAFGFSRLVDYITEYLSSLGEETQSFLKRIEYYSSSKQSQSSPLNTLLDDRIFKNDYIEISNFIKHLTIKCEEERCNFFKGLAHKLYKLPVQLVGSRLTKMLLLRFVVLDATACEYFLPHFLTPFQGNVRPDVYTEGVINPLFTRSLYQRYVLPELYKIFHVRDAQVRAVLLQHFEHYAGLFDRETLADIILPQLLLSVRDANDELVMLSLSALATLVPLLGGDIVIGNERHQLFSRGQPKGNHAANNVHQVHNGSVHNRPASQVSLHSSTRLGKEIERQKKREEMKKKMEEKRTKRHSTQLPIYQSGNSDTPGHSCFESNNITGDDSDSEKSDTTLSRVHNHDVGRTQSPQKHVSFSSPMTLKQSPSRHNESTELTVEEEYIPATDNAFDDWSDWNEEVDSVADKSNRSPTKLKPSDQILSQQTILTKPSSSRGGLGKFNPDQPLGSEYDIMQIKLKVTSPSKTSEDLDFFADMAPEIKPPKSGSLLDVIGNHSISSASRFNLTADESTVDNADGWDVDFNWEHPDQ